LDERLLCINAKAAITRTIPAMTKIPRRAIAALFILSNDAGINLLTDIAIKVPPVSSFGAICGTSVTTAGFLF
jgi:hypothetical protein